MELPKQFQEQMQTLLAEEYPAYLASFDDVSRQGLRANGCKIMPQQLQAIAPFSLEAVPWCDSGFTYATGERPAKHPYYHAGLYYLQEPSAMTPAAVLPVEPGERVLDVCAAPGGKATQLAAKLQGKGILIANDISAGRAKALLKNIELCGIRNAIVMSETPQKLATRFEGYFDKILIDAPCSGEGMFRKEPDMVKSWTPELLEFCKTQQAELLEYCATMLKDGGMLLYSTCTFSVEENEGSIGKFLQTHTEFSLLPIQKDWGFAPGQPPLQDCARLYPHRIAGEGHFVALLQKNGNAQSVPVAEESPVNPKELGDYTTFIQENITATLDGIVQLYGDTLCLLPKGAPDTKGLRVLRSGWQLGTCKKGRFTPAQAFAMGLRSTEYRNTLLLSLEDARVLRYLKGETLDAPECADGWALVCVDGYPLGWGKCQKGRLKNKYAVSWKWE